MKLSTWLERTEAKLGLKKDEVDHSDHIKHRHWKRPKKKSWRLRHKKTLRRMQSLSRRRNR